MTVGEGARKPTTDELRNLEQIYKETRKRGRTKVPPTTPRTDFGRCSNCGGRMTRLDDEHGRDECGSCEYSKGLS